MTVERPTLAFFAKYTCVEFNQARAARHCSGVIPRASASPNAHTRAPKEKGKGSRLPQETCFAGGTLYAEAKKNWTVISMKNDWESIFAFE